MDEQADTRTHSHFEHSNLPISSAIGKQNLWNTPKKTLTHTDTNTPIGQLNESNFSMSYILNACMAITMSMAKWLSTFECICVCECVCSLSLCVYEYLFELNLFLYFYYYCNRYKCVMKILGPNVADWLLRLSSAQMDSADRMMQKSRKKHTRIDWWTKVIDRSRRWFCGCSVSATHSSICSSKRNVHITNCLCLPSAVFDGYLRARTHSFSRIFAFYKKLRHIHIHTD